MHRSTTTVKLCLNFEIAIRSHPLNFVCTAAVAAVAAAATVVVLVINTYLLTLLFVTV